MRRDRHPFRPGHSVSHGTGPGSPPGLGIGRAGRRTAYRIRLGGPGRPGPDFRTRPGVVACRSRQQRPHRRPRRHSKTAEPSPGASREVRAPSAKPAATHHFLVSPHAGPDSGAGDADRFSPDGGPLRGHPADDAPVQHGGIPGRRDSAADGPRSGPGPASPKPQAPSRSRAGQPAPDHADARDGDRAEGQPQAAASSPAPRFWNEPPAAHPAAPAPGAPGPMRLRRGLSLRRHHGLTRRPHRPPVAPCRLTLRGEDGAASIPGIPAGPSGAGTGDSSTRRPG